MEILHKAARGVRRAWRGARSTLLRLGWRLQYAGFSAGPGLVVGRAVEVNLAMGGRLKIGRNVRIGRNAEITVERGTLEIGDDSHIGVGTIIVAAERIAIGADALIADYVTIRDQNHVIERGDSPYRAQGSATAPIEIGRNVWIGAGCAILAGTRIGDNCVVGANSVVTRDLAAGTVSAGAPARPIRPVGGAATDAADP